MFFQHENRFRYKFFDIVQFSRSCAPQPTGWRLDYFITEVIFCQALFSKRFERSELGSLPISQNWLESFSVYWFFSLASQLGLRKSFFCLSAWRSSIIPYTRPFGNPFFQLFCPFFSVRPFYQFFARNLHLLWRNKSVHAFGPHRRFLLSLFYIKKSLSLTKKQSRPDVGCSAFAGFIVLDFAAFHKG